MARHLIGIESPPDEFIEDYMTRGPKLPPGWDGDAWIHPSERRCFLRAWNKQTGRTAIGRGVTYEEARKRLLEDVEKGTARVVIQVHEAEQRP